jgi:hypothetical protein
MSRQVGRLHLAFQCNIPNISYLLLLLVMFSASCGTAGPVTINQTSGTPPALQMTVSPQSGLAPIVVNMTASCKFSEPCTFRWSFGDGTIGDGAVQSHMYQTAGEYQVGVVATTSGGTSTSSQTVVVVTAPPPPTLSMSVSPPSGAAPLTTNMTAGCPSTIACVGFTWDFGDGSVATGASQTHVYDAPGRYLATVTAAAESGGTVTGKRTVYVREQEQAVGEENRYCAQTGVWTGAQYDGPAELPIDCINTAIANTPSPGAVVNVPEGADLDSFYAAAQCGDILLLAHGSVWTGPFNFASKNCDDGHWIRISSDGALAPEGTRISPADEPELAQITLKPNAQPNIFGDHLRFIGIEWSKQAGAALVAMLSADGANDVIFDRNYCHGNPGEETRRCLTLESNAVHIAVVDSYLSEFHCIAVTGTCTDAQAISGGTGTATTTTHGIKIVNNYLQASGENILFGGGEADGCGPTDVEIRRNYLYKPMSWNPSDPSYGGIPYIVKNLFELKNGCRVLLEANILENVWGGYSQDGFAVVLTPKNQDGNDGTTLCPLCAVSDVTVRYNYVDHAGSGMNIANDASGNGGWSAGGGNYSVHDDLFDGLQYPTCFACSKNLNQLSSFYSNTSPPANTEILNNVLLNHITEITNQFLAKPGQETSAFELDGPPAANPSNTPQMTNIVVTNWIVATGNNGTYPSGGGTNNCAVLKGTTKPVAEIGACWAGNSAFAGNVLVGYPLPDTNWPIGNQMAADWASVDFLNYNDGNGGNYQLAPSSLYKGTATDGTDPGADIQALLAMTAGVAP